MFYDRNEIYNITISETEIEIKSKANTISSLISYSIFILMTFLPPLLLLIYEESKWIEIIALIWVAIFSYQFIQIIRFENKVKIKFCDKFIFIENEDPIGKLFIKVKRTDFNQIRELVTKGHRGRYGNEHTGLIMILNSDEKQIITSFQNEFIAKKTKNVLTEIVKLMNKIKEPSQTKPSA